MRKFCYLLIFMVGLLCAQTAKAEKTAKAIWTADNTTLTFVYDEATYNVGDTYGTGTITNVWDPTVYQTPVVDEELTPKVVGIKDIAPWTKYDTNFSGEGVAGVNYALNASHPFKTQIHDVTKVVFDPSFASVKPTSCTLWFFLCENLTDFEGLEYLDTSMSEGMNRMFYNCSQLTSEELDLSHFNTANVTDMEQMFNGCKALTSLHLSSFDTNKVTDMRSMFRDCNALTSLDVSNFNTSNVTDMSYMFYYCNALTSLVVSSYFNTSNVTTMNSMFFGCNKVASLDVSHFNTSNVTDMNFMFRDCNALTSLNVSNFNTSNVTGMKFMFYGCKALTSLDLSNFNTSKVTGMASMFRGCSALESLDLSSFNTSNVTSMGYMFNGCSALTSLDLSNFNTSKVTDMSSMFRDCTNLKTITISNGWNTDAVTSSNSMFKSCSNLVGGNGTTYNGSYINVTYAHADGTSNPGYLTLNANAHQVSISGAGMATMYFNQALTIPTGVEAWYCRSISNESSLVLAYPIMNTIPANTAVFLTGNAGSYLFEKAADVPAITNNIMEGSMTDTAVEPKSVLTLGHDQNGKLGFWYFSGTTIPAGKAYIPKSAISADDAAAARSYTVVFNEEGENQTTGISNVVVEKRNDGKIYNLNGQQVKAPTKGLYIVNGKKVIFK